MHNEFYNKNLKERSRDLRKNMTNAEKILWFQYLRGVKPRAHRQRPIGNYIVDFYIPKVSLVIEIDGDSHFIGNTKTQDAVRDAHLHSLGLDVLRFTNNDIYQSFENVCALINEKLK